MSESIKKPNRKSPESYTPQKPEILSMVKNALKNEQSLTLPPEYIIKPKDRIASFSGEKWPFSNVEPAVYSALGLLYGRTERRDDTGALINDDIEYAIHNVLTGHAFGLFFDALGENFSRAVYGFFSFRLELDEYSQDEIFTIIKDQLYRNNAVHINATSEPFDYLIWGYKNDGNTLLGYKFEHGNDMLNCSYDLNNPAEFDSLVTRLNGNDLFKQIIPIAEKSGGITIIRPDSETPNREAIYKQALVEGYRMLTQAEPNPEMDFKRVHFGYGQAIYDEWTRQIETMEKENCGQFFNISPIFPHFIALYENRLQLLRFLKYWNEKTNNAYLQEAIEICGRLKSISGDAATLSMDGDWNPMRNASNHEKRAFALDALKKCRALELEIAEQIKMFIDYPESYKPQKPEILGMAKQAQKDIGFPKEFILPDKSTAIPPEIKHIGPSYVPFANEFSYFMDYIGKSSGFVYEGDWRKSKDYMFAGVITGHAMRPAAGLVPTRDELHRVYKTEGFFPSTYYADLQSADYMNESDMKEIIMYALNILEQPVILPTQNNLFGAVVVGYKDSGNVLVIYGFKPYFMDMDNNAQPVFEEVSNWYNNKTVLTVIGKRENTVPETDMHREGMRQIHAYLNANIHGADKHYFDEWESFLRLNKDEMISQVKRTRIIPGGEHGRLGEDMNDETTWNIICSSHDSTWCNMAERRFYIAQFLYKIMDQYPVEIKDAMRHLADHYWESSKIMGGDYGGDANIGYGREVGDPVNPEVFERQDVRERMADCVKIFKDADEKGLKLTKELLAQLKI